jgi:Flp pilus assembly CpaE family ATPase
VGEQTIPSVRALKLMLDSLRAQRGETGLHVVLNRFEAGMEGFGVADLARLLQADQLVAVTADPAVKQASNQGKLLREAAPRSPAVADTNRVLCQILGLVKPASAPLPSSKGNSGLIRRLVSAFR